VGRVELGALVGPDQGSQLDNPTPDQPSPDEEAELLGVVSV
jgi:hypothetical protein